MVAEGVFKPASKGIPITIKGVLPNEPKRPEWMKVKANLGNDYRSLKNLLNEQKLNTVCEEASCPNIYECWSMGTATFMICLLYTSPSPRDISGSRMPSSA